jgi:predicted nucleic acid-binding protein
MPDNRFIYWDANIFISYLNGESDRLPTLDAILEDVSKDNKDKIVTSVLSKVEVAWVANERITHVLSAEDEGRIDALWNDPSVIELIDFNDEITHIARSLLRRSISRGWDGLKPNDAIHLATAEWVGAIEMNTYDSKLFRYGDLIGLDVRPPIAVQPRLL